METISNLASGASKLIYGDNKEEQSGQEPVSGQSGAGTTTDPFDSGNVQGNSGLGGRSAQETHEGSVIPPRGQPHTTHAGAVLDPHISDQTSGLSGGSSGHTGGSSGLTGGSSGLTGGSHGHTGGSSGLTGGSSGLTGGSSDLTGGSSGSTGGSHGHTGGPSGLTGGSSGLTGGSSGLTGGSHGLTSGSSGLGSATKTSDLTGSGPLGSNLGGGKTGSTHEHTHGTGASSNPASFGATSGGATGGTANRSKGLGGGADFDKPTGNSGPDTSVQNRESTLSGSTSTGTTGSGGASEGVNIVGALRPEHQTPGTGVTGIHSSSPHGTDVRPSERDSSRPHTGNVGGFGTAEPSVSADPISAPQHIDKQQGGDRPREAPTGKAAAAVEETKDAGEEALAKRDPNDHSGEPLKVHDGSENEGQRQRSSAGQEGGGEHGKEKGTGEQYVKTSGFKADGGDFDAAKPGAGREADRLLDVKGVHHGPGVADSGAGDVAGSSATSESASGKEGKQGVGQKIKEKLHLGKH